MDKEKNEDKSKKEEVDMEADIESVTAWEGDDVTLSCLVEGGTSPHLTWTR